MKPVTPRSSGRGKPVVFGADQQPQYRPLPALVEERLEGVVDVKTEWELTGTERNAIAHGARLKLSVLTFGKPLQPVLLTVEGVEPEPEVGTPR